MPLVSHEQGSRSLAFTATAEQVILMSLAPGIRMDHIVGLSCGSGPA
jgi:hypothetical protein